MKDVGILCFCGGLWSCRIFCTRRQFLLVVCSRRSALHGRSLGRREEKITLSDPLHTAARGGGRGDGVLVATFRPREVLVETSMRRKGHNRH